MQTIISKDGVQVIHPQIQFTEDGQPVALGNCWVDGDALGCYNWNEDDMLIIFSKIPASDDDIPEDRYYCFNVNATEDACAYGWVLRYQIKFHLDSLFGEPYRVHEV